MPIVIILGNIILAGLVLLIGFLYPSAAEWSYLAVALIGFYLVLELIVSRSNILDAAKISVWSFQSLSALLSVALLVPYKLGWGEWWAVLVAGLIGIATLITVISLMVFKITGVADVRPTRRAGGTNSAK